MTTIIEQVQAALAPLAAGGCSYAVNENVPPVYPYIVFMRVVSPTNVSLGGPSDVQNSLFQIDAWGLQISVADAVERAIEAALAAASFTAIQQDQRDGYDENAKAYRCSADYSIWSAN